MFQTKVVWLEGGHKMTIDLILDSPLKVVLNFSNGILYFSLRILIAHFEGFL